MDLDDVLYRAPNREDFNEPPTNARTHLHDGALLCVTDLVDCCTTPCTVHGDWYYPDGSTVSNDNIIVTPGGGRHEFLINRGPNEVINGRQFYGSVRLFRRWSNPPQRGRFRCELPSAADPNATQILYANISELSANLGILIFLPWHDHNNIIICSEFWYCIQYQPGNTLALWPRYCWNFLHFEMLSNSCFSPSTPLQCSFTIL